MSVFTRQLISNVISIILLFAVTNFIVLAAQDEKPSPDNDNAQTKTAQSKTETKTKEIPLPKSLTLQHKEDLTHYIPAKNVKPLLAGPDDYITLITESTSVNSKGVAILLPDWQQGATNPKAINFLRNRLPQEGWTTLSIQPDNIPENYPSNALKASEQQEANSTVIEAYKVKLGAMINAVIEKANDYPGIVMIIAQGSHGAMVVDLLDENESAPIITQPPNALILLSSYLLTNNKLIDGINTEFATKLSYSEYPVLDLYLMHDNPIVLDKAGERLSLAKKEMKVYYRQRQLINSAMGYYPEEELISQLNGWLKSIGW